MGYNANGILGLGFTSLSTVDKLVNDTGSNEGRSLLYNLFEDNRDEPNFISFALSRSEEDNEDEVEGTFTVGEFYLTTSHIWKESGPDKKFLILQVSMPNGTKTWQIKPRFPHFPKSRLSGGIFSSRPLLSTEARPMFRLRSFLTLPRTER